MNTPRRTFIANSIAATAGLVAPRLLAEAALPSGESSDKPKPAEAATPSASPDTGARQRVSGIGGFFFRASDPTALAAWYERALGVARLPHEYNAPGWSQEAGATAFAPFPSTTSYFGRASQSWMLNVRVHDLDAMVSQVRALGVEVTVDPKVYPNGRFARLHDPEGNPIELWEPKA